MSKESNKPKSTYKLLGHYMKAPLRVLVRARDMYVNSLGYCAGRATQGRVVASSVPRSQSHGFYRSRTASNEDDIRDLIRAASQRSNDHPITAVPRSQSVAVGVGIVRIDEDRQCDFGDEVMCPRSRSVSVVEKRRVGALA